MTWAKSVIKDHEKTAKQLTATVQEAFKYMGENPTSDEGAVKDFILSEFKRLNLVMDKPFATPIVAFGDHATDPHYCPVPGKRRLKPGTLVMIDIWARMRGKSKPYADITWMGYYGVKVPKITQLVFDTVIAARDSCLKSIQRHARKQNAGRGALPPGNLADETANEVIRRAGFGRFIKHSTGHVLGFASPHGRGRNLNRKNRHPLLKNIGYTIEPGIYIDGKLGIRSEINFYVNGTGRVIVTTQAQRELFRIG